MPAVSESTRWSIESRDEQGGGLRVSFTPVGGRFAHAVEAVLADGEVVPLLQSIEGGPADHWPPSPPLQEVHLERRAGGRDVLLAVGRAGISHWSLSVEASGAGAVAPDRPNSGPRSDPSLAYSNRPPAAALLFDIACRVKMIPESIGSAYRTLCEFHNGQVGAARWALLGSENSALTCQLTCDPTSVLAPGAAAATERITITANRIESHCPRTLRWSYVIELLNGITP